MHMCKSFSYKELKFLVKYYIFCDGHISFLIKLIDDSKISIDHYNKSQKLFNWKIKSKLVQFKFSSVDFGNNLKK